MLQDTLNFIDQPKTYFCLSLAALIIFSFKGTTKYLRYSLAGISVFYALIAAGVSLASHEHRGFQYVAPDYYAAAFFAAFSAFGFLSAALITQRRGLLRTIVIFNCITLALVMLYFNLLSGGGLHAHLIISETVTFHMFKYYASDVLFLSVLVLSLAIYVYRHTLKAPDQRRQRLIKSASISLFVFWAVFLAYPLAPLGIGGNPYSSFAFDSVTRGFFYGFDIEATNNRYETRLHVAARNGDLEKVRSLLRAGANPYAETRLRNGSLPLDHAADRDHLAVQKRILDAMDDINFRDQDNRSLVHIAAKAPNSEFLEYLMRRSPSADSMVAQDTAMKWAPIHQAAASRSSDWHTVRKIRILLEHGADVNAESGFEQWPLELAVLSAKVAAVQELLKHGADPNILGFLDKPLLQIALEEKQKCETKCSPIVKDPGKRIRNLAEIIEILESTSRSSTERSSENSSKDNATPARISESRG